MTKTILILMFISQATAQDISPLPKWAFTESAKVQKLNLPDQIQASAELDNHSIDLLILDVDPSWQPIWKDAAFQIKSLIVNWKTRGENVQVGLKATPAQINALLEHETAPYFDGYLFSEEPFLPEKDASGKLWQLSTTGEKQALNILLNASEMGCDWVLFQDSNFSKFFQEGLNTISKLPAGTLDPPSFSGVDEGLVHFYLDANSGDQYISIYAESGRTILNWRSEVIMEMEELQAVGAQFKQFGPTRSQLSFENQQTGLFVFKLIPQESFGTIESMQIATQKSVDPYELVVKNQVFKDQQNQEFESLIVDEEVNYRYQAPTGTVIDITFMDTVYRFKDQPTNRARKELFIGGVKWPYKEQPELPIIEPLKVQQEPLSIDLDKSYTYTYKGEQKINGHMTWQVNFEPQDEGDFESGSVWIDQKTGAHRRVRAVQSKSQSTITSSTKSADFDWVEINGEPFWTQISESNLLAINIVGERIVVQQDITRSNHRLNLENAEEELAKAYESDFLMLRDTEEGFKYLVKADGKRVINNNPITRKKLLLGGVFFDPSLDTPIPLAGLNYTDLDFREKGYQLNLFMAGVLNVATLSNPDLFGKGWTLTADAFITALYFEDSLYEGDEEVEELTIKSLREALNVTLGIPLGTYMKANLNYSLRYLKFDTADETDENYVLPQDTLEHIGRFSLSFDRRRFSSLLQYETATRSDWEPFGIPDEDGGFSETFSDTYSSLQFDAAVSARLPKFQTVSADVRYLKGWDLDRFSRFGFGFFDNTVSGFGTSGIRGDEAARFRVGYDVGVKGLFQLNTTLDTARAWDSLTDSEIDLTGVGLAVNFVGPWKTLMRANIGYGLDSSLEDEAGDTTGQIVFLRIF